MEKMERSKVSFKWRELYEVGFCFFKSYRRIEIRKDNRLVVCMQAKLKVVEEDEKEAVDRLKQRYKNEDASTIFRLLIFCYGHLVHC